MAMVCVNPVCGYTARSGPVRDMSVQFCPDCGKRMESAAASSYQLPVAAAKGQRFLAYMIDALIGMVLFFIITPMSFIPVIGFILAFVIPLFWLFRDIKGASPGKAAMGLQVVSRSGEPSTQQQRIMRNLPFGFGFLPYVIPFLGTAAAAPVAGLVWLAECIAVLATGERLGDKLAGTVVVKK